MILPIFIYGNKELEQAGKEVASDYPELKELTENMFETMHAASGIGLAAQQIGLSLQLFVIDLTPYKEGNSKYTDFKKVFLNAEILESSEEVESFEEGCLSFPGLHLPVKRPSKIKLKYTDENFVTHEEWFDDLAARCIQHELDHTKGTLFTIKASPFARTLSTKKMKLIKEGNFTANYKHKKV